MPKKSILVIEDTKSVRQILAAMLLDEGYEVITAIDGKDGLELARRFVLEDMADYITAAAESENQENYKSHLQQYVQKHLGATPLYEMLDEKGPDHSKCFEVCVAVGGRRFPSAWGPSKKEAEQKAALSALQELHVVPASEDEDEEQEAFSI